MIAVLIRLWRSVSWSGIYGLIVVVLVVGLFAWAAAADVGLGLPPLGVSLTLVAVAGSLVGVVIRWGGQQRPTMTKRWEEVVEPLVRSTEEYCLILRPFGEDGRIILPYRRRRIPWLPGSFTATRTLEQVVATAVSRVLGMKAYALVDQKQLLAPPGTVWLRTSAEGNDWQSPISALMQRAHSIVLILPPGQTIRPALKWEIGQITLRNLQSRVLIVLPSPDRRRKAYLQAHHQACLVLATFEELFGDMDDVDTLRVAHYQATVSEQTMVTRMSRQSATGPLNPSWWAYRKKRGSRVAVADYVETLTEALTAIEAELSTVTFESRYPWKPTPLSTAKVRDRSGRGRTWSSSVGQRLLPWVARLLVALLVVALTVVAWRWRDAKVADDAATFMVDSKTDPQRSLDRYAQLRLGLRAFRTAENDKTRDDVRRQYRMFGGVDRAVPDYLGQPLVLAGKSWPGTDGPSAFPNKVSADGRTLVTTDANRELTLWRLDGRRVTRQGTGRTAGRITLGRSGRYVAYLQDGLVPGALGQPINECAALTGTDPCVFLRDTSAGQSRLLGRLTDASIAGHVPVLRIDPADQVVAAAVPVTLLRERIVLWDIASGTKRVEVDVPVQVAAIRDMWLLPGGRSVVLEAEVPRFAGSRLNRKELLWLDLSRPDAPATSVLSPDILNATVNLDGTRLAAMVVTSIESGELHSEIRVWHLATRQPIAHVPNLSRHQSTGTVSLDAAGTRIYLTSIRDPSGTNGPRNRLDMWSVPDGTPVGAPVWLDSGWTTLVPLGNGDAAPLALVSNDDVVGLVPAGQGPTPIRRLADRSLAPYDLGPPRAAGRWYREMCDMLVSDVEPRSVMDHLPPGAHTGPLCS